MNATMPTEGDVYYPRDRGSGMYVKVLDAQDDWVSFTRHDPGAEPYTCKVRLSTFCDRYDGPYRSTVFEMPPAP